jgi:hypothetical protein
MSLKRLGNRFNKITANCKIGCVWTGKNACRYAMLQSGRSAGRNESNAFEFAIDCFLNPTSRRSISASLPERAG